MMNNQCISYRPQLSLFGSILVVIDRDSWIRPGMNILVFYLSIYNNGQLIDEIYSIMHELICGEINNVNRKYLKNA